MFSSRAVKEHFIFLINVWHKTKSNDEYTIFVTSVLNWAVEVYASENHSRDKLSLGFDKNPRFSLSCTLVPVLRREYEYGLLPADQTLCVKHTNRTCHGKLHNARKGYFAEKGF